MKVINTNQLVKIPEGVTASVKSRVVTVKVRKCGKESEGEINDLILHHMTVEMTFCQEIP